MIETKMWKYYITQRPPMPGAMPRQGLKEIWEYGDRIPVYEIERKAYGYLLYDRELTPQEISEYELVEAPEGGTGI